MSRPGTGPPGPWSRDVRATEVVVAGLGNEYRHDDGAGPRVAPLVAARAPGSTSGPSSIRSICSDDGTPPTWPS